MISPVGHARFTDELPLHHNPDEPITATAARSDRYSVHVLPSEADSVKTLLGEIDGRRVALITDDTVAALHARRLSRMLADNGVDVSMTSVPPGETSKSLRTAFELLDWLAGTAMARRDVLMAVGGGMVIDLVGWVASAYMRGIPYVNVPTTLLAQVDAALGGKVAVDHDSAKNLIGAFYQPKSVVSNVSYLSTLDDRQMRSGLAEAIKKGVIASPDLFELIDVTAAEILRGETVALERLVAGASEIKCRLIARDPYEEDLRRPLNFGHTVGHAVETVTGYGPVLHGEAVAFGMAVAVRIAENRGLADPADLAPLLALLRRIGLPTSLGDLPVQVSADEIVGALGQIRKIRGGSLRFVLPIRLGETLIADDLTHEEIRSALLSANGDRPDPAPSR
ncbi:3-dehydroquinate synthase [Actinomadura sp. SCN-SB]|uniref:3-dehydroquinate synthase n=1 Tax=Actinomadura sp. SCN-SB TaxID=3373092 RepID=UPI0037537F20